MNYQAILESSLSLEGKKVGLGSPKAEKVAFESPPQIRRKLTREKSEVTIEVPISGEEQPDVVVVSADVYELKYKDTAGVDTEKTTSVRYKPIGNDAPQGQASTRVESTERNSWINLTTAHVFRRLGEVVDLNSLLRLKFEISPKEAIPANGSVTVEVFVGTSAK